ncbi:MAG: VOC family protein [Myxococcales bacterium]|nr:VOC family protein [Myxococcales bacterium]
MTQSGRFVWAELFTTKKEAALEFYGELLGWSIKEMPMGDFNYTMFSAGDTGVGGVGGADVNESQWLLYLTVDDVDAKTKQALSAGAQPYMPPTDIPTVGRFSVIIDPQGAAVALFKPASDMPESAMPKLGEFCWHELMVPDAQKACDFYGPLVGWTTNAVPMGPMTYYLQLSGEKQRAGVMQTPAEMEVPPYWMPYVLVENVDKTAQHAEKLGGQILIPATDIPNIGRFVVVMAPDGSVLAPFQGA